MKKEIRKTGKSRPLPLVVKEKPAVTKRTLPQRG